MKKYCTQITIEKTSFGRSQNLVSNLKSEFNFGKFSCNNGQMDTTPNNQVNVV